MEILYLAFSDASYVCEIGRLKEDYNKKYIKIH